MDILFGGNSNFSDILNLWTECFHSLPEFSQNDNWMTILKKLELLEIEYGKTDTAFYTNMHSVCLQFEVKLQILYVRIVQARGRIVSSKPR